MNAGIDYGRLSLAIEEWIREIVSGASAEGLVVGLSGGLDSAVSAALGARALGRDRVLGLIMPCGSSGRDTEDGLSIARHIGIDTKVIDLTPVLEEFIRAGGLQGIGELGRANIKARLRMTALYAHSGNRLVLGTSNYSEIRVGYWTKWGDGASDLLPIGRLYKDEVRALAGSLGLPQWIVDRVPSAGLWPGQSDEAEMGVTYDDIRAYFTGGGVSEAAASTIGRMIGNTEHKRRQVPYFHAREWMGEND